MSLIQSYKDFLTKENNEFITNTLLGNSFPYYLSDQDVRHQSDPSNPSFKIFCHTVLQREEYRSPNEYWNSKYKNQTLSILDNFFKKAGFKKVKLFRIAYNYTFNIGIKQSTVHVDHQHDHFQVVIYLSDTLDKDTPTILVDKDNKVLEKSYPEKGKGVLFKKIPHYHVFPKEGARLVLVATFQEI